MGPIRGGYASTVPHTSLFVRKKAQNEGSGTTDKGDALSPLEEGAENQNAAPAPLEDSTATALDKNRSASAEGAFRVSIASARQSFTPSMASTVASLTEAVQGYERLCLQGLNPALVVSGLRRVNPAKGKRLVLRAKVGRGGGTLSREATFASAATSETFPKRESG